MIKNKYLLFTLIFIMAIVYLHTNEYTYIFDDVWFSRASYAEHDHIKWVIERYYTWSSRTPIEYALITLINSFILWSVCNAAMFALLLVNACNIASTLNNDKDKHLPLIFIIICVYSIPKDILFSGAIWVTGSFNYLWPIALTLAGHAIIIKATVENKYCTKQLLLCALLFFLSSFNEQLAVANIIILAGCVIYFAFRGATHKIHLYMFLVTCLVMLYIITCPGNKIRYDSEVLSWFKSYNNFNVIEKAMLGLNLYSEFLFSYNTVIPSLVAFSISSVCDSRFRLVPALAGCVLLITAGIHTTPVIFSKIKFSEDMIYSAISTWRITIAFIITSMMFFPLTLSKGAGFSSFFCSLILVSTVASVSMLGFSPTVYASGGRTLFIPYLLFSLITIILTATFFSRRRAA